MRPKKGPHLVLVVKIWQNTRNAEKYSGNPKNTTGKNNRNICKNTQNFEKLNPENTNENFKNSPHLILVKNWENAGKNSRNLEKLKFRKINENQEK